MNPFAQSLLTFAIRRGLTVLGGSAANLTDNQIAEFVGISMVNRE